MTDQAVFHATFSIGRRYDASPATVFAAFAEPAQKRRWFAEGEGWAVERFDVDFRIGGYERSRFRYQGGPPITNDTSYQDIVPDRRIVIAYTMTIDGAPLSSSLATIAFRPDGRGTRLVYTEQAAFFDGTDQAADREAGCRELLDSLGRALSPAAAAA